MVLHHIIVQESEGAHQKQASIALVCDTKHVTPYVAQPFHAAFRNVAPDNELVWFHVLHTERELGDVARPFESQGDELVERRQLCMLPCEYFEACGKKSALVAVEGFQLPRQHFYIR